MPSPRWKAFAVACLNAFAALAGVRSDVPQCPLRDGRHSQRRASMPSPRWEAFAPTCLNALAAVAGVRSDVIGTLMTGIVALHGLAFSRDTEDCGMFKYMVVGQVLAGAAVGSGFLVMSIAAD